MIDKHWCDLGATLASTRKEAEDKAEDKARATVKRYLRKELGTGHDYARY
jgi:hypothetical protein